MSDRGRKFWKLVAAVSLAFGPLATVVVVDTVAPDAAHAWLYNCSANYSASGGGAWAGCQDAFQNGGQNQVRVVLTCKTWPATPASIVRNGGWVLVDHYSTATCMQAGYHPYSVTYQLR